MQFAELAADYLRQHHYAAQVMSPPPFNYINSKGQWEGPKATFWVGYPKPAAWFVHTNSDEIHCAFYRSTGKRKMRKMRSAVHRCRINDQKDPDAFEWSFVGLMNDPTILDKIVKTASNPPYWIREHGDFIMPKQS